MVHDLRGIPGTRVVLSPFTRYADVGFNAAVPRLSDVRVRRALAYATDRKALVDKVTHGVTILGETDQPPFSWSLRSTRVATIPTIRPRRHDCSTTPAGGCVRRHPSQRRPSALADARELHRFENGRPPPKNCSKRNGAKPGST